MSENAAIWWLVAGAVLFGVGGAIGWAGFVWKATRYPQRDTGEEGPDERDVPR